MKRTPRNTGAKKLGAESSPRKVPTHADMLKAHHEARRKLLEGVEIVCERFGDESSFYHEALALSPTDEIILLRCTEDKTERQPITPFESVIWMGHAKWAEKFDADTAAYDEATSRWLLIIANSMRHKNASVVARRRDGSGVYVITLTRELSEQWEAASKAARIPLDWMIHDTLKGDAEHYLASGTGYAKDSRDVWLGQRKQKIPIQVTKG